MSDRVADLARATADDVAGALALVARLRSEFLATAGRHIGRGTRVALIDIPNHPNGGDTAIWLGEMAALRALGCEVAYLASAASYSPVVLRRRLGREGIVLLHGGGNLGDLWPTFQRFREAVIAEHRERRIVQLPQSLHFQQRDAVARAAHAFGAHPDVRLLLRDRPSLEFCLEHFPTAAAELCPDAAFALGPLKAPTPAVDVLIFARTDQERRLSVPDRLPTGAVVADWPQPTRALRQKHEVSRLLGYPLKRVGRVAHPLDDPLRRLFLSMGHERLTAGLDVLASGRIVITDRLHGHILSLLLGRPHVLLDNNYGKNRRFYDQWTHTSPLTLWADDLDGALVAAGASGA